MNRKKANWILTGILVLGAAARLGGIWYRHFPDESFQLYRSLKIGAGEFTPNWFMGVYTYLMFGFYSLFFLVGRIGGIFPSIEVFMGRYYTDPLIFYWVGRAVESAAGIVGIWMLYRLGRCFFDRGVSLASAFFLAFNLTHIQISQFARGQAFALLFGMAALFFVAGDHRRKSFLKLIAVGIFLAAAISIRIYYLAYFIPVGIIFFSSRTRFAQKASDTLALIGVFIASSILFTPELVTDLPHLLGGLYNATASLSFNEGMDTNFLGAEVSNGWVAYLFTYLPVSLGWPLYVISWAGMGWLVIRGRKLSSATIIIFPIVYLAVMGKSQLAAPRYAIPIMPFLFLSAASFVGEITSHEKLRRHAWIFSMVTVLLVSPGIPEIVSYDLSRSEFNTIDLARQWILDNIPDRAGVAVESTGYAGPNIRLYSVIDYDIYRMSPGELKALYRERMKGGETDSRALRYFIDHPPTPWHRIYDLNVKQPVDIGYLLEEGVEYFVISSGVRDDYENDDLVEAKYPQLVRNRRLFYRWVEEEGKLLKSFSPGPACPGPRIDIYRVY